MIFFVQLIINLNTCISISLTLLIIFHNAAMKLTNCKHQDRMPLITVTGNKANYYSTENISFGSLRLPNPIHRLEAAVVGTVFSPFPVCNF